MSTGSASLVPVREHEWANGARIATVVYLTPVADEDESDRIQLLVTDQDGQQRGWLMNVEDALAMISCLTDAIARVVEERLPLTPER